MTRRRVGPKEKNHWRQFVEPVDTAKKWFPLNFSFLVEDRKIKEIQPVSSQPLTFVEISQVHSNWLERKAATLQNS